MNKPAHIDISVWEELPLDIRKELSEEARSTKRTAEASTNSLGIKQARLDLNHFGKRRAAEDLFLDDQFPAASSSIDGRCGRDTAEKVRRGGCIV